MITASAPPTITAQITMPGIPTSVACARNWAREALTGHPCAEDAIMVVSELGTNAVKHTRSGKGGWWGVLLRITPEGVVVKVDDAGSATTPKPSSAHADEIHGRGLQIVDALASQWGTEQWGDGDDQRCSVWARIDVSGSAQ